MENSDVTFQPINKMTDFYHIWLIISDCVYKRGISTKWLKCPLYLCCSSGSLCFCKWFQVPQHEMTSELLITASYRMSYLISGLTNSDDAHFSRSTGKWTSQRTIMPAWTQRFLLVGNGMTSGSEGAEVKAIGNRSRSSTCYGTRMNLMQHKNELILRLFVFQMHVWGFDAGINRAFIWNFRAQTHTACLKQRRVSLTCKWSWS